MVQRRLLNSVLNGTSVSPLSSPLMAQESLEKARKIIDTKVVDTYKGAVFWAQQAGCTHDLSACDSMPKHCVSSGHTEISVQRVEVDTKSHLY